MVSYCPCIGVQPFSSGEDMMTVRLPRRFIIIVALLIIVTAFPAQLLAAPREAQTLTAVVATGALNVRSGPGIAYGVIAVTYQGHVVILLGRNTTSTWAKIRLYSGQEGWVNAGYLYPSVPINSLPVLDGSTAPPAAPTGIVNTGALNIRSGPGVAYGVVTVAYHGQVLTLLGRNANSSWAQVRTNAGVQGWVNASLITSNVAISSLPVTDASTPAPTPVGVVTTSALNVRSGPGVAYGVVAALSYGQSVYLLARTSDSSWIQVRLFNGVTGWVNGSYLQSNVAISSLPVVGTTAPTTATAVVATGALNVRYGPGVQYGILAVVYRGYSLTLVGRNYYGTWVQVRFSNGAVGWVNASLVQANVPISSLPVTS
jgi:uncharacterized protein YgiM (DUF1202 family)